MFTPTNDPEDIYLMDPYSSLPSPLNFFEFDDALLQFHDPAMRAENILSQPPAAGAGEEPTNTSNNMVLSKGDINEIAEEENARNSHGPSKQVSRKRSSKADRHSKIPTKNGLRDRRMRLSLDVARQFFKLQDMLIFDKPSKTVKWLLLQAKSAIEELKKGKKSPNTDATKSASSTSEGEFVESAIEEEIVNDMPRAATTKDKSRKTRKNTLCPAAKELRKKAREEARERARERTQQKNQSRLLNDSGGCLDDVMNLYQCHLRPNGLELGDESVSQTHTTKPFEIDQDQRSHFGSTEGFIGSSSTVTTIWNPLMGLNYHQEDDTFQANPISEFQFHGTSREPYNPNLGQYWY